MFCLSLSVPLVFPDGRQGFEFINLRAFFFVFGLFLSMQITFLTPQPPPGALNRFLLQSAVVRTYFVQFTQLNCIARITLYTQLKLPSRFGTCREF